MDIKPILFRKNSIARAEPPASRVDWRKPLDETFLEDSESVVSRDGYDTPREVPEEEGEWGLACDEEAEYCPVNGIVVRDHGYYDPELKNWEIPDRMAQACEAECGVTPSELFQQAFPAIAGVTYLRAGLMGERKKLKWGDDLRYLQMEAEVCDGLTGRRLGERWVTFRFDKDERGSAYVSAPISSRDEEAWAREVKLFRGTLEVCRTMRVSYLTADSSGSSESRALAALGFVPSDQEEADRLFTGMRKRLNRLNLLTAYRERVERILAGNRPQAVAKISDLQEPKVVVNGREVSLADALFGRSKWSAVCDLKSRHAKRCQESRSDPLLSTAE